MSSFNNCAGRSCWSRRWSSSALSTMKFLLLRLDRSPNFVYFFGHNLPGIRVSNLRLTVGEDLLLLVQKSPNLCVFRVWLLTCFNNGLPRSIVAWRRRLTNRQAFSLGVIDLSSVCVKEHLTDCGIIVIHVLVEPLLREPLLRHGLLIELEVRLCGRRFCQ